MEEITKELKHALGMYNKCLSGKMFPVEELNGRYKSAFDKVKKDLEGRGINYIKAIIPERSFEAEEEQKQYDSKKKDIMNLLAFALEGYVNLEGVAEENVDDASSRIFIKACKEAVETLETFSPVKAAKSPKQIDYEGACKNINELKIIPAGSIVSSYSSDYKVLNDISVEEKKFDVLNIDTNKTDNITIGTIIRVTASDGRPLYKANSVIAEENFIKRAENRKKAASSVQTEQTEQAA